MYWARAKNILIFTLLALNIFLAANLYIYSVDRGASSESEATVAAILKSRNIEISCKIPKTGGASRRLNFISKGYDRVMLAENLLGLDADRAGDLGEGAVAKNGDKQLEILTSISFRYTDSSLDDLVDMTRIQKTEKYAVDFLRSKKLLPDSFIVDEYVINADNSITFLILEKYGDKLIYDNYLKITVKPEGVSEITGSHRSIKKAETARQGTPMSAQLVILKNFTGNSPLVVEGLDMGYKENSSSVSNMIQSNEEPVWRIKIKGESKPGFFNVFTGDRIE
jgi:hypothetical protein